MWCVVHIHFAACSLTTRATHIMPISPPIMLCSSAPIISPIIHSHLPPTMLITLIFQDIVVDSNNLSLAKLISLSHCHSIIMHQKSVHGCIAQPIMTEIIMLAALKLPKQCWHIVRVPTDNQPAKHNTEDCSVVH